MNNTLVNIPVDIRDTLAKITSVLLDKVHPDMIVLFGSYARGDWVSDSYVHDNVLYDYHSDLDILVIVENSNIKNDIDLWNDIQKSFHLITHLSVNLVVDTQEFVLKQLQEGNYFYLDVKKDGLVLFDNKKFDFNIDTNVVFKRSKEMLQRDFDFWMSKAHSFYLDYGHNIKDNAYNNAAFHLSQVVESLLFSVLVVLTGYKPKAHNIDRLLKFVVEVAPSLKSVFECNTQEEKKSFELLKRAYIDARYKKDYTIELSDLTYLSSRVDILFEKVSTVCNNFIKDYKN